MDRNLRIRMLIEAGDRATRPLRDIAAGGSAASRAIAETRGRLKELQRAQADIASFRGLKAGLRDTGQQLASARTRATELGRALGQAEKPTRAMTRDFAQARAEVTRLERQQHSETAALDRLRTALTGAGISTRDLSRHERDLRQRIAGTNQELSEQSRRLHQSAERQRRFAAARGQFGKVQGMATGMAVSGAAAIGSGVALATPLLGAIKAAQEFESKMTTIGQKANLTRGATAQLGKDLLVAARASNQMPEDIQAGVDSLTGLGASIPDAMAMITPISRAATAYKASQSDLGNATYAAINNLKVPVAQTAKTIDIMAASSKRGAFEVKDMAQYFPSLAAAYQGLGQAGTGAVADLSAGLQIVRKGAGDSAEAGTNLSNILQKISSPATNRAFAQMGVDLPNALKKAYHDGKTPLEAIAELTNKTLNGDLSKLGYLFEDAQVQKGLRPIIQNLDEFRSIRAEAMGAGGTTDRDYAERMKDSAEQTKNLRVNIATLGIALGAQLLPTVNAVVVKANAFATWVGEVAKRYPNLTRVIALGAAGLAALFVVLGGGALVIAGLLAPFAALTFAARALNLALLPTIGIAAGIVAGIALIAAGAYLIYNNWGAISGFFTGLWTEIKAGFAGGLTGIAGLLYNFSPVGLLWRGVSALLGLFGVTLPARLTDAGRWMIQGLINGITSKLGYLKSVIIGAASAAAGWFKNVLGIHSPSRVFAGFGGNIIDGLTNGIRAQESEPVQRLDRLSRRLSDAIVPTGTTPGSMGRLGAGGGGPRMAMAAPAPITIHVHGAPGQSEEALGNIVARKLAQLQRPARSMGGFGDRPDWED